MMAQALLVRRLEFDRRIRASQKGERRFVEYRTRLAPRAFDLET